MCISSIWKAWGTYCVASWLWKPELRPAGHGVSSLCWQWAGPGWNIHCAGSLSSSYSPSLSFCSPKCLVNRWSINRNGLVEYVLMVLGALPPKLLHFSYSFCSLLFASTWCCLHFVFHCEQQHSSEVFWKRLKKMRLCNYFGQKEIEAQGRNRVGLNT